MKMIVLKVALVLICLGGMFAGGYVLGKTIGDDRATRQWESLYHETLFTHALTRAAHEHRIRQAILAGDTGKALSRAELGIDRALLDAGLYTHTEKRWELFFLRTQWSDLKQERADFVNKRNAEEDRSINEVLDLVIDLEARRDAAAPDASRVP